MEELYKQAPFIGFMALMVSYFLNHMKRIEEMHDKRVAAFITTIENIVSKYGSVVRMVVADHDAQKNVTQPHDISSK